MFHNNFEHHSHPMPLTDLKFSILKDLYLAPHRTADYYQILNKIPYQVLPTHDAITELIGNGYVETIIGSNDIRLTLSGIDAYESEYQRRKEYADDRAEQAANRHREAAQIRLNNKKQFQQSMFVGIITPIFNSAFNFFLEQLVKFFKSVLTFFK